MPNINTTYGAEGVNTSVPTAPAGGVPGADTISGYIQQLLALRVQQAQAKYAEGVKASAADAFGNPRAAAPAPQFIPRERAPMAVLGNETKTPAQKAQEREIVLRQQARERPPQQVWTNPMGTTSGFLTTAPDTYNAYQREAYLPSGSSMAPNPADAPRAELSYGRDVQFNQQFGMPTWQREAAQRAQLAALAPGR